MKLFRRPACEALRLILRAPKAATPLHYVELVTLDPPVDVNADQQTNAEDRQEAVEQAAAMLAEDGSAAAVAEIVKAFFAAPPPEEAPLEPTGEDVSDPESARMRALAADERRRRNKRPPSTLLDDGSPASRQNVEIERALRLAEPRERSAYYCPAEAPTPGEPIPETPEVGKPILDTKQEGRPREDIVAAVDVLSLAVRMNVKLVEPMQRAVEQLRKIGLDSDADRLAHAIRAAGTQSIATP